MIWADRIAITWGAFIVLFISSAIWFADGDPTRLLAPDVFWPFARILFFLVGVPWLFLRIATWAFRGSRRA